MNWKWRVSSWMFMPHPGQTGRQRHYVLHLSTGSFICYKTSQYSVLKINEPVLMAVRASGPRGKGMKRSTLGSGGQGHKSEIGHKNPFRLDISRTVWQTLTKPGRHILVTVNANCITTTPMQKVKDQGYVRPKFDLETWKRHVFDPLGSISLSSLILWIIVHTQRSTKKFICYIFHSLIQVIKKQLLFRQSSFSVHMSVVAWK